MPYRLGKSYEDRGKEVDGFRLNMTSLKDERKVKDQTSLPSMKMDVAVRKRQVALVHESRIGWCETLIMKWVNYTRVKSAEDRRRLPNTVVEDILQIVLVEVRVIQK